MTWRTLPRRVIITALAGLLAVVAWAVLRPYLTVGEAQTPEPEPTTASVTVVADAPQIAVPPSFLGLSTEYWTLPMWERQPADLTRVLDLLRAPGDPPLTLRIGGDSADHSMWDGPRSDVPDWAYELTPQWLTRTRELVEQTGARLILDLNLVTASPAVAAQWAAASLHALPARSVLGFEVGNEPDIYSRASWMAVFRTVPDARSALPAQISSTDYTRDFEAYEDALDAAAPGVPLLGPALANPASHIDWLRTLLALPHTGLREVTVHRYPYSECSFPGTRTFATIDRVLSPAASEGLASGLRPVVAVAHAADMPVRVSELNSVTCGGRPGVSDTFATALWAPDALFSLAQAGVQAADIHVRQFTVNGAFAVTRHGVMARPLLYGLVLFARTLGPDARIVPLHIAAAASANFSAWAVRVRSRDLHVLLLDKGSRALHVALRLPGHGAATIVRMLAPSVAARTGETLGGQSLTAQARWRGRPVAETVVPRGSLYQVTVPRGSAALMSLTLSPDAFRHARVIRPGPRWLGRWPLLVRPWPRRPVAPVPHQAGHHLTRHAALTATRRARHAALPSKRRAGQPATQRAESSVGGTHRRARSSGATHTRRKRRGARPRVTPRGPRAAPTPGR